ARIAPGVRVVSERRNSAKPGGAPRSTLPARYASVATLWRSHRRSAPDPVSSMALIGATFGGRLPGPSANGGWRSPAADERHLGGHHGQKLDVGIQRQARHVDDRARD